MHIWHFRSKVKLIKSGCIQNPWTMATRSERTRERQCEEHACLWQFGDTLQEVS